MGVDSHGILGRMPERLQRSAIEGTHSSLLIRHHTRLGMDNRIELATKSYAQFRQG